ncbi:SET domain protein [Ophiocordyceps camponoti-floridani]|uniref:SET domain protein n=1 Tax=Ophiocordyceps camponoti-floridani TaxID=2030778 RepID=A0A8H4VEE1_9HYPO|nr:SET domain protein [Ophiocordyceps camponoti-floridani]
MKPSPTFTSQTEAFIRWFEALPGAKLSDAVEIADLRSRDAGRGIVATRDIPADTLLFRIPRKAILSVETSELKRLLPGLLEPSEDDEDEDEEEQGLSSWSATILVLMYEHFLGEESSWKPYLSILPETFDTPMFWTDDEITELQASALPCKIGRAEADDVFRKKLLPIIRSHPDIFRTSQDYSNVELVKLAHRMGSTIMAYAFDLENENGFQQFDDNDDGWVEDRDNKALLGMVPMADMMNADAEFNAHVNHEDENLSVSSLRPITAGEEVLNYYGPYPNSELLRRYGFVTEKHARYDDVELPWDIVEDAIASTVHVPRDVVEKTRRRIDTQELDDSIMLERDSLGEGPVGKFIDTPSVYKLPEAASRQLKSLLKALPEANLPHDKPSREAAKRAIISRAITAMQSRYPTTTAQDEQLLQQDMSKRRRMAIQVRLGEKRIMDEFARWLG